MKYRLVLLSFLYLFTVRALVGEGAIPGGYPSLPCDPGKIIGVEQKSGKEDQGIPYYEDMSFGVSGKVILGLLREMKVNNIRIPIMNKLRLDGRGDIIVNYVKKIHDAGGRDIGIILSVRRHNLGMVKQQDHWCIDLAYIYNALKEVNLHHMVVGCAFDENGILRDKPSNQAMWDNRHRGVLQSMIKLNEMTGGDFKMRTVFIHGKGLGSMFSGARASSESLNFPEEIKKHCGNYCYNFKFYQTGFSEDPSKQGWMNHLNSYCGFDEVAQLGVPMIYVGDSGDGIRGGGFNPGTRVYGKCGPEVMHALLQVFVDRGWSGFSFGVFNEGLKGRLGKTALYMKSNGEILPIRNSMSCWDHWRNMAQE